MINIQIITLEENMFYSYTKAGRMSFTDDTPTHTLLHDLSITSNFEQTHNLHTCSCSVNRDYDKPTND